MLGRVFFSEKTQRLLALVLAAIAFTQWGYLWYATIFDDVWQTLIGRTEDDLISMAMARGYSQTLLTYLISAVQAGGLYIILRMSRAKTFMEYQFIAAILSIMIALPVLGNEVLFAGSPTELWVLDFMHFILGYAGMALIFFIASHFKIANLIQSYGIKSKLN